MIMPRRYIIIGNGDIHNYCWYKSLLTRDDVIVCADGGARHAIAMNVIPDIVLGDFDSLNSDIKDTLLNTKCKFIGFPEEKDMTDTELALKWCMAREPMDVILMGVLGTRMDHSIANILLLTDFPDNINIKVINEYNEIFILKKQVFIFGSPGDMVSIIPLSEKVKGVSTKGLKYILRDGLLEIGSSRGISNEMVGSEASIKITEGIAIVTRVWDQPCGN
jgi:thiamine pyrophosphokinase